MKRCPTCTRVYDGDNFAFSVSTMELCLSTNHPVTLVEEKVDK